MGNKLKVIKSGELEKHIILNNNALEKVIGFELKTKGSKVFAELKIEIDELIITNENQS